MQEFLLWDRFHPPCALSVHLRVLLGLRNTVIPDTVCLQLDLRCPFQCSLCTQTAEARTEICLQVLTAPFIDIFLTTSQVNLVFELL